MTLFNNEIVLDSMAKRKTMSFLARDSIIHSSIMFLARYMLSPVRPSVRHTSKTVEVRIMKFSPYGSPIPLGLRRKFHPEIQTFSPSRASNKGGVRKAGHFLDLNVNISKTVGDMSKVTINN